MITGGDVSELPHPLVRHQARRRFAGSQSLCVEMDRQCYDNCAQVHIICGPLMRIRMDLFASLPASALGRQSDESYMEVRRPSRRWQKHSDTGTSRKVASWRLKYLESPHLLRDAAAPQSAPSLTPCSSPVGHSPKGFRPRPDPMPIRSGAKVEPRFPGQPKQPAR